MVGFCCAVRSSSFKVDKRRVKGIGQKDSKGVDQMCALHLKSDIKMLYMPRGISGPGLISCESYIRSKENSVG